MRGVLRKKQCQCAPPNAQVKPGGKLEPSMLEKHAAAIVAKLKDSDAGVRIAAVDTLYGSNDRT